MDKNKFEIKLFHLSNGITWIVAFLLYAITQQAKPQDIDMFNYGIETQISRSWNTNLIGVGKWILLILCISCCISFIANIVMSIDTKKRFSVSQLIVTLLTIWFTFFYFSNF